MSKILLIEDDEATQKIYSEAFKKKGFKVFSAQTGVDAVTLLRKEKPDLIVLDIMLPGKMHGFDLLENFKRDEETKEIPVFVLTNLDSEEQMARDIGADDYAVKANTSIEDVIKRMNDLL